jgi:fumarylacetoacetate (FAA) hydrolase
MKLITYDTSNGTRAGVVVDEQVLDVATLLKERDGAARDVRALLELPNDPLTRLKSALDSPHAAQGIPLDNVRLRAPILQPPTVRDFMTYEGHANAGGTRQLPDSWYRLPVFYFSNPLCIFGPEDAVPYPSASEQLD